MVATGGVHSMEILAPSPPTTVCTGSVWKLQGDRVLCHRKTLICPQMPPEVQHISPWEEEREIEEIAG